MRKNVGIAGKAGAMLVIGLLAVGSLAVAGCGDSSDDQEVAKSSSEEIQEQAEVAAQHKKTNCGNGISVRGPNTSCAFAEAVGAKWRKTHSESMTVHSPTTGQNYKMTCGPSSSGTVCKGGNNAIVEIKG